MMDKNFFVALAASMLLLFGYNYYYNWRFADYVEENPPVVEDGGASATPAKERTEPPATVPSAPPLAEERSSSAVASPGATPIDGASYSSGEERKIVINTGVTTITLSSRGGVPVGYILNGYHDATGGMVNLYFDYDAYVSKEIEKGSEGSLTSVVRYPLLGLKFPQESFSRKINGSLYDVSEQSDTISLEGNPKSITFTLTDSSGITIVKSYTFRPDSFLFDFSVSVTSTERWGAFDYSLVWFGLGDEATDLPAVYSYQGPVVFTKGERVADDPDEDEPFRVFSGDITWVGLTNRYYTAVGMPEVTTGQKVTTRYLDKSLYSIEWANQAQLTPAPVHYTFFFGPKEHNILREFDNGVYSMIHYGWFDFIAKPLYTVLQFFHGVTGNWGWSIILLTILAKTLFFPLSQKSFRSMQKMQELQPKMKKIQDAYKDDKEQMNQAMMTLYREQKVNPLGGCLPMLLQIPIFFSLYKVLLESIELKGADFIFWIHDLSLKDPYYVTPVLMGVSMLLQQLMTPATGDPLQRKVMMALPVVFTFLFLSFPAGLVVYWFTNNVLTIGQQWLIRRENPKKS